MKIFTLTLLWFLAGLIFYKSLIMFCQRYDPHKIRWPNVYSVTAVWVSMFLWPFVFVASVFEFITQYFRGKS